MIVPYVGVTGPSSRDEAVAIMDAFEIAGYSCDSHHIPMIGYLVSHKTLNGEHTPNLRYPSFRTLPGMMDGLQHKALNMVHYNTREQETLADQISEVFSDLYPEGLCRALQLNVVWPDRSQVAEIRHRFPEMKIVFQASRPATEGRSPEEIVNGIAAYGSSLDYVLIDPSGGNSTPFTLPEVLPLYHEIRNRLQGIVVGFAGGFHGMNVRERTLQLLLQTGDAGFCLDAEGGLRDKLSERYGDDLLNMRAVQSYLDETMRSFSLTHS